MHQERPGVNHLIPQRQPRRPSERCRRDEGIADLRRAQVEVLRDVVHGLSHGRVIEEALSLADDKVLVGVLMDWMRWLDRRVDLHDYVDPGAIASGDGKIRWDRGTIEKQWCGVLVSHVKAGVAQNPAVALMVIVVDDQFESAVDFMRGRDRGERDDFGFVENDRVHAGFVADHVDRGLGGSRPDFEERVVRQYGIAIEDLVDAVVRGPDGVVARELVELHEHRVARSGGDCHGVDFHGLDVPAINGVHPHRVLVYREHRRRYTGSVEQVQTNPLRGRVDHDGLRLSLRWRAAVEDSTRNCTDVALKVASGDLEGWEASELKSVITRVSRISKPPTPCSTRCYHLETSS